MRNSTNFSDEAARAFEAREIRCEDVPTDRSIVSRGAEDSYQHALQALRDVRHMLPSDGVSIADAVLGDTNLLAQAGAFFCAPEQFIDDGETLKPEQENESLEGTPIIGRCIHN